MRIATIGSFNRNVGLMQELQAALDRTQRQIASGNRLLSPSDDPIAAGRALELNEALTRINQFDRNGIAARNRLSVEESALSDATNILQRVRELALQANNATQNNDTKAQIAAEMRGHLDALVQLANRRDGNGNYLFSGNMDATEPVSLGGGTYTYNGDQSQRFIQIGESRQIADGDTGFDVFFQIRNGNGVFAATPSPANSGTGITGPGSVVDPTQYDRDTYTIRFISANNYEVEDSSATVVASGVFDEGEAIAFQGIEISINGSPAVGDEFEVAPSTYQSMFATIDNLASALESPSSDDSSRAHQSNAVNTQILSLDQSIDKVLEIRSSVGSRLNAVENEADSNSSLSLALNQTLGEIQDLDYAEALSRLSLEITTLEAAQQAFVRTSNLTLFNLL